MHPSTLHKIRASLSGWGNVWFTNIIISRTLPVHLHKQQTCEYLKIPAHKSEQTEWWGWEVRRIPVSG